MAKWRRIMDEPPPQHKNVLFKCTNGDIYQGRPCYGLHDPWWCIQSSIGHGTVLQDRDIIVTHWMHESDLPDPA